jgi:hypothetical protein
MDKDDLLKEMLLSKEQGKWTKKGVEYIIEIVDDVMEKLSGWNLSKEDFEDVRYAAIIHCSDHGLRFKPEKLKNGYSYLSIVARSSFASNIVKIRRRDGLIPPLPPGTVVLEPGEWAESTKEGIAVHKTNN